MILDLAYQATHREVNKIMRIIWKKKGVYRGVLDWNLIKKKELLQVRYELIIISYFATVKLRESTVADQNNLWKRNHNVNVVNWEHTDLSSNFSFEPVFIQLLFQPEMRIGEIKISRKSNVSLPDRISFFERQLPTGLGVKVIQSLTRWNPLDWRRHPRRRPWRGARWRSWRSAWRTGPGRGCWRVVPTVCAGPRPVRIVLQLEVLVEVGGRLPRHLLEGSRAELVARPSLCSFLLLPANIDTQYQHSLLNAVQSVSSFIW